MPQIAQLPRPVFTGWAVKFGIGAQLLSETHPLSIAPQYSNADQMADQVQVGPPHRPVSGRGRAGTGKPDGAGAPAPLALAVAAGPSTLGF